jgi:hypothetical protein
MLLFFPVAFTAVLGGFWLVRHFRTRLSSRVRRAYPASFGLAALTCAAVFPFVRAHAELSLLYYLAVFAVFTALNLALVIALLRSPSVRPVRSSPSGLACPSVLAGPRACTRRHFLAGGVLAAAGTLVSMAGVDAATGSGATLSVRRIDLSRHPGAAPGRPLRLSLVSDLHAGFFLPRACLAEALGRIAAFSPDAILFGGDLIENRLEALDEVQGFLDDLRRLAPVYGVLGNHDCYIDPDAVAAFHRLRGVRLLRGESEALGGPFGRFTLCGMRDMMEPDSSFGCLEGLDMASTILLAHNPQLGLLAPHELVPWLTLSGHTHGGQICLPGMGPLVNQADRRILAGLNMIGDRRIAVTAGLGWSGLPVRFLCPPDVTNIVVS